MYHVPLAVQCIYVWSDEGDEDGEESEIPLGRGRVEITWLIVCR